MHIEKRKVYGTILGVTAFVLLIIGITYAIFQWVSGTSNNTNVKLTVSKDLESLIIYKQGTSILETAGQTLNASENYSGGISATIEFYKKPTTKVIYGRINMEILNMLSITNTTDANIKKTDTIKWAITTWTSSNTTETLLEQGTFNGKEIGNIFPLYQNFELSTTRTFFKIYLWFDQNAVNEELSVSGELLSTEISAEATDVMSMYGDAAVTLNNLGLSVSSGTPDFSKTSCSSGCEESTVGIYESQDDLGTTYYFRGDVENNYVYFANYYWRIIRINGDGGIRMIYDGTTPHDNGESSTDRQIGTSAFNSSYNSNAFVGYKYGSSTATTYEETHANTSNSAIKQVIDSWYKTNISDKGFSSYLVDSIYCNDRSLSSGTGIGATNSNYKAYERLHTNNNPTFYCTQSNDKFTVNTSKGNGSLQYPVGLVTADEMSFAGAVYYQSNSSTINNKYYLYMGNNYWTMTPYAYDGIARVYFAVQNMSDGSGFSGGWSSNAFGVRPVITLNGNTTLQGTGTKNDPFVVDYAKKTLNNLKLSVNTDTPDFSKTSCSSGCEESTVGVYMTKDDFGPSYYFRGDVENNYFYFAGFYWRIIRINGDGSIRMIYDGTNAVENGSSTIGRGFLTGKFNSSINDNAYVGYMYGTAGSSTYDATHANTNDSTIKTALETWYNTNITNDFDSARNFVVDTIYCNDRKMVTDTTQIANLNTMLKATSSTNIGYGMNTTYYGIANRADFTTGSFIPSLKCEQVNDRFTVDTSKGNGKLQYPVGLITADELVFAGSTLSGSSNYLKNGANNWTMSPIGFVYWNATGATDDYFPINIILDSNGKIEYSYVSNSNNLIRPVISIDIFHGEFGGSGTKDDPFWVQGE